MSESRPIVFVVDDEPAICLSLKRLVRSVGLEAQTFDSAQEFLRSIRPEGPGCLVLDVRLPGLSGLDLQQELADAKVDLPIIFMTGHGDIPMSVRAMKRGAVDFLAKPFRDQDMLDAVMAAIERDRQRRKADNDVSQMQQRFETLSPREQQVMLLVTAGKMNKQVAGDLGISEITVKIHRGAAMRKMEARNMTMRSQG